GGCSTNTPGIPPRCTTASAGTYRRSWASRYTRPTGRSSTGRARGGVAGGGLPQPARSARTPASASARPRRRARAGAAGPASLVRYKRASGQRQRRLGQHQVERREQPLVARLDQQALRLQQIDQDGPPLAVAPTHELDRARRLVDVVAGDGEALARLFERRVGVAYLLAHLLRERAQLVLARAHFVLRGAYLRALASRVVEAQPDRGPDGGGARAEAELVVVPVLRGVQAHLRPG